MQIPALPTDNLYKFIALSGLLIILVSFFVPIWMMHQVNMQRFDLDAEAKVGLEEALRLKNEIELLEEAVNEKKVAIKEAKRNADELDKLNNANLMNGIRRESQLNKLHYTIKEIRELKWIASIGCFLGVVITIVGFLLWYNRLQKYQDILVKKEANAK